MDDLKNVSLPERPSKLWFLGLAIIVTLAVAGIISHFVVLHRVMNLEQEKAAWSAAMDQRLEEEKRLDAQLKSRRDERQSIQRSVAETKAELAAKGKEFSDLQTSLAPLQQDANTAQANRQRAQTEYDALSAKVAALTETLQTAQSKLEQAQNGLEKAEGRKAGLQDAVGQANRELGEKQAQLERLNGDVAAATESLGQKKAERPQLEASIKKLQQEEVDLTTRKNDLDAAVKALDDQRAAVKAEIDTQNAKLVQAKASLDDTTKQKEVVVQSAQQSREAAARAEGRKAELDKSIIEVEQRLDGLRKQEKQLNAGVTAGKDTSAALEAAISELESGRRRGYPRRPPTPPGMRFRTGRFMK